MKRFLFFILFVLLVTMAATSDDEMQQKTRELDALNQRIRAHRDVIGRTEKQARDVARLITKIEGELVRQNQLHEKVNGQIDHTKGEISKVELDLFNERKKFEIAQASLMYKVDQFHRLGESSFIETLFNSDELTDHLNELYFFEVMITTNVNFLADVREKKTQLTKQENKLSGLLGNLKTQEHQIVVIKTVINENKKTKEKLYQDLMQQKAEYEKQLNQLERDSAQIQEMIVRLQKESGRTQRIGDGRFIWPVIGQITSYFGKRVHPIFKVESVHTGLDIAAPLGRPVFAASDGIVLYSGNWGGYGKTVVIDHGASLTTIYGHLSAFYVKRSAKITKGQVIALVGSTGWSTGPHLHFEVRLAGNATDPLSYLPSQ